MTAAAAAARVSSPAVLSWARQGAETLAAALRIVSDLTAQEVAMVVGAARERISLQPVVSAAETITTGSAEAGKILLDLAAGQSAILTDALKEGMRLGPGASALTDLVAWWPKAAIDLLKRVLDEVAEQTEAVVAYYMDDKPLRAGERLAGMARRGVIAFIEAQKAFLDEISDQVAIATQPAKEAKAARRSRSKVLVQLARDAVEKYAEAQKQLAELAIGRLENGLRQKAQPRTSLSALAREGVQKFTEAQKSLLDLALKEISAPAPASTRRARRAKKDSVAEPRATARETARRTARGARRPAPRVAARAAGATAEVAPT